MNQAEKRQRDQVLLNTIASASCSNYEKNKAIRTLFDEYEAKARSIAFFVLHDEERVTEIVHVFFAKLLIKAPSITHGFSSYLNRSVYNEAVRQSKLRARYKELSDDQYSSMPKYGIEDECDIDWILLAIAALKEQEYLVFEHKLQQIPAIEVADELGMTRRNVDVKYFRVREKLKGIYQELMECPNYHIGFIDAYAFFTGMDIQHFPHKKPELLLSKLLYVLSASQAQQVAYCLKTIRQQDFFLNLIVEGNLSAITYAKSEIGNAFEQALGINQWKQLCLSIGTLMDRREKLLNIV